MDLAAPVPVPNTGAEPKSCRSHRLHFSSNSSSSSWRRRCGCSIRWPLRRARHRCSRAQVSASQWASHSPMSYPPSRQSRPRRNRLHCNGQWQTMSNCPDRARRACPRKRAVTVPSWQLRSIHLVKKRRRQPLECQRWQLVAIRAQERMVPSSSERRRPVGPTRASRAIHPMKVEQIVGINLSEPGLAMLRSLRPAALRARSVARPTRTARRQTRVRTGVRLQSTLGTAHL